MGYFHNPDSTRAVSYTDGVDAAAFPTWFLPTNAVESQLALPHHCKHFHVQVLVFIKTSLPQEALLQALSFPPGTFL